MFARWRSDIVLHYVQDSALSRFTTECLVLMRKDSIEQIMPDGHVEHAHLRSRIVEIALGCPKYVRNETPGTWHKTAAADLSLRPADWCTFCGWRFSSGNFQLVEEFPSDSMVIQRCTRCFPVM